MPRKIKKPTPPELLDAANQTLADRLQSIEKGEPVLCQHLKRTNNHYFCACATGMAESPELCIYKIKKVERVQYAETENLYVNQCFALPPNDLKLLYLSRKNHPGVNFILDKFQKSDEGE